MKTCFIHTPVPELKDDRLDPPVGLLYMATLLNKYSDGAAVIDLSGTKEELWREQIPFADYYGFSTYTASYHRTLQIRDIVLEINPEATTIAGGPHATALPKDVIGDFNYVVTGEGERTILGITSGALQKGVYEGDPVGYLNELPFPDYSLVNIRSYTREFDSKFAFPIFASRGCYYKCAFCSTDGRLVRYRSPENVVTEIQSLRENYGDVSFRFKDDLFAANIKWLRGFADISPDIVYSCNVRGNTSEEAIELLASTGCKWACMGIESGSDEMLVRMNKRLKVARVREVVASLKRAGIKVLGWFIVGFPGETWDTVRETADFINEVGLDKVVVYPLIPYPGTPVWKDKDKYGVKILDDDFSHYFYIHGDYESGFVYETDALSPGLIKEMREYVIGCVT